MNESNICYDYFTKKFNIKDVHLTVARVASIDFTLVIIIIALSAVSDMKISI